LQLHHEAADHPAFRVHNSEFDDYGSRAASSVNAGDADACWRHSFVTSPKRMLRGNFSQ
jgi:hypothetical protein